MFLIFIIENFSMKTERLKILRQGDLNKGPVIYWMSRDQRSHDNWALLYAQELAIKSKSPLIVLFCLVPDFLEATLRQYSFMFEGLKQLKTKLESKNIEFKLLTGKPDKEIPNFIIKNNVSAVVCDFDPLKIKREWQNVVLKNTKISFYEVDAHNIVPCRYASEKQEWAAYTFRPKIHRLLDDFMDDFPQLREHPYSREFKKEELEIQNLIDGLNCDKSVKPVDWIKPGEQNAKKMLDYFIDNKLDKYRELRNDPSLDYLSNLSPYLHFGQISAQRVAMEVAKSDKNPESKKSFLEELIVRRELSDNYCFNNQDYDNFNGFPDWAKQTHKEHRDDIRPHIYSKEELEKAQTHDELWNASQLEMMNKGKMHGYMRMYWAKKILEWTESPEQAQSITIYLNDKYELDGRDPNGYTGIAWSIGGVHDRAWPSRDVFGKVRYMSYKSTKSKFNASEYIRLNLVL